MRSRLEVGFTKHIHVFRPSDADACKSAVLPICRTDGRDTFLCLSSATAPALPYLLHPCSRKKSIQKKGHPNPALILCFTKTLPGFRPADLFAKSCDARGGIGGLTPCLRHFSASRVACKQNGERISLNCTCRKLTISPSPSPSSPSTRSRRPACAATGYLKAIWFFPGRGWLGRRVSVSAAGRYRRGRRR